MKMFIPVNLTTGREYKPVTETRKEAMEKNPHTQGKYRFKAVSEAAPPVVASAKKVEPVVKATEKKAEEK